MTVLQKDHAVLTCRVTPENCPPMNRTIAIALLMLSACKVSTYAPPTAPEPIHTVEAAPPEPEPTPAPASSNPFNFKAQTYEERCGSLTARFRAAREEWHDVMVQEPSAPRCKDHIIQRTEYDPRFNRTFIGPNERIRTCPKHEKSKELADAELGVSLLTVELRQNRCNVPR